MPLPPELTRLAAMLAAVCAFVGCSQEIGAKCTTGTDCSQTGGRVCDTTMPAGYCTIPNCDPDSCPEEAACISFVSAPSSALVCEELNETRTARAFCMKRCSSQEDCRGGYACLDVSKTAWAKRIDKSSKDARVCTVDFTASLSAQRDADAEYCTATARVSTSEGGSDLSGSAGSAGADFGLAGASGADAHAGAAGQLTNAGSAGSAGTAGARSSSANSASGAAGDGGSHAGSAAGAAP